MCLVIVLGEQGEGSLQTNLESFNNLDKMMNDIEKKKSFMMGDTSNVNFLNGNSNIKSNNESGVFNNSNRNMDPSQLRDQDKFEIALKEELNSRKDPFRQLEIFISRIKRLCHKLDKVLF